MADYSPEEIVAICSPYLNTRTQLYEGGVQDGGNWSCEDLNDILEQHRGTDEDLDYINELADKCEEFYNEQTGYFEGNWDDEDWDCDELNDYIDSQNQEPGEVDGRFETIGKLTHETFDIAGKELVEFAEKNGISVETLNVLIGFLNNPDAYM